MGKPYIEYTTAPIGSKSRVFGLGVQKNAEIQRSKTVQEHREFWEKLADVRPVLPGLVLKEETIGGVPCLWVERENAPADRVIVYIHGGSWAFGSLQTARAAGAMMAESTGHKVLVVQYRLAPEHPFPAALDDCFAVYRHLLLRGFCHEQVGLFGDSAGGNLSLCLIHRLKELDLPLPAALALASPVTDMTEESVLWQSRDDLLFHRYEEGEANIFDLYTQGRCKTDPLISPIYGDLTHFPPILIHVGGAEPLAQDCVNFANRAAAQGVAVQVKVWNEMFHDFTIVGVVLKESRQSIKEMGQFLTLRLDVRTCSIE